MGSMYLDHAAATPLDERVFLAMQPYFSDQFYNPSSVYEGGRRARQAYEDAKHTIGQIIGAKPTDITTTAGATESINLAVRGVASRGGHVVVSGVEHAAVRGAAAPYDHSVTRAEHTGLVTPDMVREAIRDDTVLVCVTLADGEFGTVQPVADIARMLQTVRDERRAKGNLTPLYLFSDGSQAVGALDVSVARLGVDMLTLSAAKCYGPKQVGLLWKRPEVVLTPLLGGGGQEAGLRSGTENVAGVVGFAAALGIAQGGRHAAAETLKRLRGMLLDELQKVDGLVVDGHPKKHLPGFLHVHIPGLDAERVVFHLDNKGVCVATGAACSANRGSRSPSLDAVGMPAEEADGSLRLTLGRLNDEASVRTAAVLLVEAIETERRL